MANQRSKPEKVDEDSKLCEGKYPDAVINSLPGIFYLFDKKGRLVTWNKNLEKRSGYTNKEIKAASPLDFFIGNDKKLITATIKTVFTKGHANVEANLVSKNGKNTPYLFSGSLVKINGKEYLAGMGIDVSHVKETESKLVEYENRFQSLIHDAPFSIELYDTDGNWLDGNKAWEKLLGLKAREVKGKFNLLNDKQARKKGIVKYFKKAVNGELVLVPDLFYSAQEAVNAGRSRWLSSTFFPVNGHDSKPSYIAVVHRDITDQVEKDNALKNSEAKYRLIYEMTSDAILTNVPPTWNFGSGNAAAYKLFGIKNEKELLALKPWQISPKYQPNGKLSSVMAKKMIELTMKNGSHSFEWVHKKMNGDAFPARVRLNRVDANGRTLVQGRITDITEIKQAENNLRKSKELFEDIARCSGDWLWEIDADAKYVYASGKVKKILGYSPKQIIGKSPFSFMPEDEALRTKKIFNQSLKEKKPIINLEHVEITADGNSIHILTNGVPVIDNAGHVTGYRGINTDTSIQKHEAEKDKIEMLNYELISSVGIELNSTQSFDKTIEKVLKKIGNTLNICQITIFTLSTKDSFAKSMYSWAHDPKYRLLNKRIRVKDLSILVKKLRDAKFISSYTSENLPVYYYELLKKTKTKSIAVLPVEPFEKTNMAICFGYIQLDKPLAPHEMRVLKIIVDMISRANARQAVRQAVLDEKNKLEKTLYNLGEGVIVLDKNLVATNFNHAAEIITGIHAKDIIGCEYLKCLRLFSILDDSKKDKFILNPSVQNGRSEVQRKTSFLREDNVITPIAYNATTLKDRKGNITGYIIVFRDLTIEQIANKLKTEFVSIASHQLRTPLTGVKWLTESLLTDDNIKLNAQQKRTIKEIRERNEDMIKLVGDLLNVSKMEDAAESTIKYTKLNLNEIIKSVVYTDKLPATNKGVKLIIEENRDSDNKIIIESEEKRIKQAIRNVIDNAIKYSNTGGEVTIRVSQTKKDALIDIEDTGIGIPPRQQGRVFQKFFRGDNAVKTQTSGTGLGLYICKLIILAHGGDVWFESEINKGTTFHIKLPKKATLKHK